MGRRRRGIMSEELKYELAKDLGFYDTVMKDGWEGIRTKDAGNMVKRAIQLAEQKLAQDYQRQQGGHRSLQTQPQTQPRYQAQYQTTQPQLPYQPQSQSPASPPYVPEWQQRPVSEPSYLR